MGDRTYPICRQRPWPAQTPTLLAWLKRHRPELFGRIGTVLLCKDFVVNRLTGARVSEIVRHVGLRSARSLPTRRYDEALMEAYGLGDCMPLLPRAARKRRHCRHVTEEVAALTGLAAGTPVVGGLFDVVASALGSGVTRTGSASIIAGTWSINQVIIDRPDSTAAGLHVTRRFDRTPLLAMENSATSAANLEWLVQRVLRRRACGRRFALRCSAASWPRRSSPRQTPALPSLPLWRAAGRPCARRLLWHCRLAHQGASRCARCSKASCSAIAGISRRAQSAGAAFNEAVLSGGGSRSAVWPQIFADVLGVPVTVAALAAKPARWARRSRPAPASASSPTMPPAQRPWSGPSGIIVRMSRLRRITRGATLLSRYRRSDGTATGGV